MHIGFIMDGNRRWAKARGLSAQQHHEEGFNNIERVIEWCSQAGVDTVSLWGLATNNIFERSKAELASIYGILKREIQGLAERLKTRDTRFDWVGDGSLLPEDIVAVLEKAKATTASGKKATVILAIAYGGCYEIVQTVKKLLAEKADPASITEQSFFDRLDTGRFPAPDLIVRTGGHQRHSGYFLYASEYSEYIFTPTLWPDFSEKDVQAAIAYLQSTARNFGK